MDFTGFIAAHGEWKRVFRTALTARLVKTPSTDVKHDDRCAFGKFFYALPEATRATESGREVQAVHGAFHVEAARIVALMERGRWQEAEDAIGPGSQFEGLSRTLTQSLFAWNRELARAA